MEITEKHLQEVYDLIEERAIKHARSPEEHQVIINTAYSMMLRLRVILHSKSEEELVLSDKFTEECIRMLTLGNGDITVAKYECGHSINPFLIISNIMTLENFNEWKNDKRGFCPECWLKTGRVKC